MHFYLYPALPKYHFYFPMINGNRLLRIKICYRFFYKGSSEKLLAERFGNCYLIQYNLIPLPKVETLGGGGAGSFVIHCFLSQIKKVSQGFSFLIE